MWGRLKLWLVNMVICCNQLIGCWLRGWYYVWVGGELPDPDEPMSSWIHRRSSSGKAWAGIAEKGVDWWLGFGHCAGAAARHRHRLPPVKLIALDEEL